MRHLSTDLRRNRHGGNQKRHERRRHPHLPTLYYMTQNREWAEVIRRSRTHPHEALIREDLSGNTSLHVACRLSASADAIRALIRAGGEESVTIPNMEGATPLHLAASHRCSAAVVDALIRRGRQMDEEEEEEAVDVDGNEDQANMSETEEENQDDGYGEVPEEISPTAILTKMGRTPIHYACMSFRGLDVDAFRILVQATVEATQTSNLDTIRDEFDEEEDDDDITTADDEEVLDDAEPKLVAARTNIISLRDGTGQTPLGLLFRRYRERVRCVLKLIETSILSHHASTGGAGGVNFNPNLASTVAAQAVQADLGELWEKARLIVASMSEWSMRPNDSVHMLDDEENDPLALEAAAWASRMHCRPDEDQTTPTAASGRVFRIVHASVGLTGYGCPPEMTRLAVTIHPSQVYEMDEDGNLPLHIAAVASSACGQSGPQCAAVAAAADPDEQSLASSLDGTSSVITASTFSGWSCASSTSTAPANPFDRVMKILLRHYPQAAKIPNGRNGRLPLVLAMDAGRRTWDDGMRTLLRAYPGALESKNLELQIYPSILSLVGRPVVPEETTKRRKARFFRRGRKVTTTASLDAIFGIVRARPQVVCNAINKSKNGRSFKRMGQKDEPSSPSSWLRFGSLRI